MQPASKPKTWDTHQLEDPTSEPPTKIQAIEVPEGESDGEYEAVPKKLKRKNSPEPLPVSTEPISAVTEPVVSAEGEKIIPEPTAPDATDDDWLRGRTSRLLDLMDPDDIPTAQAAPVGKTVVPIAETIQKVPKLDNSQEPPQAEEQWEGIEDEKPDPTLEAIKSNGRLFVRNLPYSATEDDLREHFAAHGTLEEVQSSFSYMFFLRAS